MTGPWLRFACITLTTLGLGAAAAADETSDAEVTGQARQQPGVQRTLQPPDLVDQPIRAIVPENPGGWGDPHGGVAIEDWKDQNPYGYGTDMLFPLTRDLQAMDLALWAKIPIYPVAALYDLGQLPIGALGGLWGR